MDVSIAKNLEWVFSGIGVFGLTMAAKGLYSMFKQSRKEKADSMTVVDRSPTVQHGQTNVGHVLNVHGSVSGGITVGDASANQHSLLNGPPQKSTITAKQIQDDILAAPPFQADERAKHYVGLPIDWNCLYQSITKKQGDVIGVALNCPDAGFMFCHCDVLLSDYPRLKVLPADTPIRIVATLAKVEPPHLRAKDATLYF